MRNKSEREHMKVNDRECVSAYRRNFIFNFSEASPHFLWLFLSLPFSTEFMGRSSRSCFSKSTLHFFTIFFLFFLKLFWKVITLTGLFVDISYICLSMHYVCASVASLAECGNIGAAWNAIFTRFLPWKIFFVSAFQVCFWITNVHL